MLWKWQDAPVVLPELQTECYSVCVTLQKITAEIADIALSRMEVDNLGLDNIDRKMMMFIIENFNGGPVGLDTLAASIGEDANTIEDVYEPYLLQLGFLSRTPRGRMATIKAYEHFGVKYNNSNQLSIED